VVDNLFSGRPATAKRLRQTSAPSADAPPLKTQVIKVVVCEQCGDKFAISHDLTTVNPELAERQATWLADQFVWDHIQENKHRSSITLPAQDELNHLATARA